MSSQTKKRRLGKDSEETHVTMPPSLIHLCMHFVACHLFMVESLVGLPDIIGEAIFRVGESEGKFKWTESNVMQEVSLFCEAYGGVVLSCLDVHGHCAAFNLCEEYLRLFLHLCELDISDCGLGDEHDILSHVGHLILLKKLSLRRNNLSDTGIQRLTSPYRILGRGPGNLGYINVSENEDISSRSVMKYLSPYQQLTTIDVTGTTVKSSKELLRIWKFVPSKDNMQCEIVTKGWAADVVSSWLENAVQRQVSSKSQGASQAKKFYSQKQKYELPKNSVSQGLKCERGYKLLLWRVHTRIKEKSQTCKRSNDTDIHSMLDSAGVFDKTLDISDDLHDAKCHVEELDENLMMLYK